jgi:mRNA interferase YafQ
MLKPIYLRQFERDLKLAQQRGKNIDKLKKIITLLVEGNVLPAQNRNHKLKGTFKDYFECHIEPDWLLIYKKTTTEVILVRTGTHSDLF